MKRMDMEQTLELDLRPAFCQARVLVLGVGNVLFGDDGFGPAVVDYLFQHYDIPDDVYVMDVGTGVRKLLFTLILGDTHPEEIVIVDAVDWGYSIGDVKEIAADELPVTKIDDFSLHQVPTSNMLRELQEQCEVEVSVRICDIGALPQVIAPGLSPKVKQAVKISAENIATQFTLEPL